MGTVTPGVSQRIHHWEEINMAASQPWLDGNYKLVWNEKFYYVATVEGEDATLEGPVIQEGHVEKGLNKQIWKNGIYGEADEKICEATGKSHFVLKIDNPARPEDQAFGVVSDDGKLITLKGQFGIIVTLEWIDEEEAKALKKASEDDMDPYEAPPNHYTLRPGHVGKLVWISGAPGLGKSTTARRMMETQGFVYYEGDCFFDHKNPYLPLTKNSAIDELLAAKHLKDVPNEITAALARSGKEWKKLMEGREDYDVSESMGLMCENILKERKRVGGDWVVAFAVTTRKLRDMIKEKLGPQLVFVVLDMDKDLQQERLVPRLEALGETFNDICEKIKYEPASDDEENVIDLKITRDMQLDDVVKIIMEKLDGQQSDKSV